MFYGFLVLILLKAHYQGRKIRNYLTLKAPTLQNGQTHLNNSSATAEELSECA